MDIGLSLSSEGSTIDIAIVNGDIALDGTLMTAILISLYSDALAGPNDVIPDGSGNRRGFCLDGYLPPLPDGTPWVTGSKLWLYARCTATQQNALLIQEAAQAALAWMVACNVAQEINVSTQWLDMQSLALTVKVSQATRNGTATTPFNLIWDRTLGTVSPTVGFPQ